MKRTHLFLLQISVWCLIVLGLSSMAIATPDQRFIRENQENQEELIHASDTLTDPEYQDKKKANEKAKKKAQEGKEESSVLDTVKEMFHNAFDYFYGTEEIKEEEKKSGKK